MFLKFMEDKSFSNIFQYVEQMAKVTKHLRISESPRSYDFSQKLCTEDGVGPVGLCYNCPEYIITANLLSSDLKLKEHMRDLSNKLGLFMVSVSVGVYQFDGFLGFHMDLLALCDGEISKEGHYTTLHCFILW